MSLARSMDNSELNNETAIKEVQHLLKNGITSLSPDLINKLRSKYSDDNVVDSIMEFFIDRRNKITKVAEIFIEAFQRKYGNDFFSMSLSKFMKRALKYKKRYNLSDDEFDEIRRCFEMKVFNTAGYADVIYPNTNLSRVLGYPITESTDKLKPSNTEDYGQLQDILRIYEMFKGIHSYVVIQTMTYTDLADEAMNGTFNKDRHDVNRFVHPVLAALFLPKITELEERMLYANIAGIVNSKYNGQRILTKPDYELFYSMVIDPSDTVCDNVSPIKDLKSRAEVQVQLWNNVYNLRNGKYYDAAVFDFIAYIDKCRISNVDNPDVMYLSDEGVILRRLFNVFSFRPIIVSTQPVVFQTMLVNPLNIGQPPVNMITSIPYITYRIPNINLDANTELELDDSNKQIGFYMDPNTGSFAPRLTRVMNINGPIIYYIPRKMIGLPLAVAAPQVQIFSVTNLNNSVRQYTNINQIAVKFNDTIETSKLNMLIQPNSEDLKFHIRSVVAFDLYSDGSNYQNVVVGHNTYLCKRGDNNSRNWKKYHPRGAIKVTIPPTTPITDFGIVTEDEQIRKTCSILVYSRKDTS